MRVRTCLALLVAVAAPAVTSATLTGQELARRVSAVENGTARLTYPARPGVEICDQGIRMGQQNFTWRSREGDTEPRNCRPGPVEVEIRVRDGSVRDVFVIRRLQDRTAGATDLGSVSAEGAVAFLMEAARHGGSSGEGVEEALFPTVLADVDGVWRDLLATAKDRALQEDVRTSALFWVGQEAADAITAELGGGGP